MNILGSNLWSKQTEIQDMILDHLDLVQKTLEKFKEGMGSWIEEEDVDKANQLAFEIHELEGDADDLRRQIEQKLIGGALLARSRSEMLDLIERTDKLANAGEASMDFTVLQEIRVPEELKPLAKEIVDKSVAIMEEVKKSIIRLFEGEDALEYTAEIEATEGKIDDLERNFIRRLFKMDLEPAQKILLRQYSETLVEISDRAEDLSDRIEILVATRKT